MTTLRPGTTMYRIEQLERETAKLREDAQTTRAALADAGGMRA